jgi:hypothetical protein
VAVAKSRARIVPAAGLAIAAGKVRVVEAMMASLMVVVVVEDGGGPVLDGTGRRRLLFDQCG